MAKKFNDYMKLKNRWMDGSTLTTSIDQYSEVLQVHIDDNPTLILSEDELTEFIKMCEKSLQALRGK